ncbi:MAG: efflux RND transporter periplasmic adaptor subunit [Thiolinea sp.]
MFRALVFLMKTIVPLAILAGGIMLFQYLMATGPEPRKRPPVDRTPVVEVKDIRAEDYTVNVKGSGIVRARTQSSLVTEVAGRVLEISPNFRPGAYVEEDEVLLTLDDTNYQDAIRIANSNIAANEAALAQLEQEELNVAINLQLAQENLQTVQQNLEIARRNINNVQRKTAPINKNTDLIKRNINLARKNYNLTQKNLKLAQNDLKLGYNDLKLAQRNLELANQELKRLQELRNRKLIAINQLDGQRSVVLQQQQQVSQQRQQISQKQQQIVQLEQNLVQQQQQIVQQEQQLTQQDTSLAQQDQNVLAQQQQILQQEQAVNQQRQSVANLEGQLATFDSRRNSLKANNDLTRTQLLQQQRNLERTKIKAPYAGRILEQRVDLGQYVSPNAVLGILYATDYVEVDMQLTLDQYALLEMPDAFAGEELDLTSQPVVEFTVPFGKDKQSWTGFVTGTRASLNEQSRQITVVARIDNPYERREGRTTTLKIGQYLNADIEGRTFEEVYVLPPAAVRQNRDILQMVENTVQIAPIEVVWSTEEEIVVTSDKDLQAAPVIITALGQATTGMKVALPGQKKKRGGGKPEGGKPADGKQRDTTGAERKQGNGEGRRSQGQRPAKADDNSQTEKRRKPAQEE